MPKRNEERMRIESIMQKEREETEKVKMQKTRHINDVMNDYLSLINKKN